MDLLRADLRAAEIDERDARGRRVVLRSLRHSLATMLAQSNVPPAVAMKILRHRDIRLTLQVYTDEGLLPTAAAMATLPTLSDDSLRGRAAGMAANEDARKRTLSLGKCGTGGAF